MRTAPHRFLSRLATHLVAAVAAVAAGQVYAMPGAADDTDRGVATDTSPSDYVADLDRVNAAWPGSPAVARIEDVFRLRVRSSARAWIADTHLFPGGVNVIPYDDGDGATDAAGNRFERGDGVVAGYFPPGDVGFAVKHRRAAHRQLFLDSDADVVWREELKLRDTHVSMVLGVVRDGRPGVITVSSPQGYASGRFGGADYPMIFFRSVYPSYLSEKQRRAFVDNVRTMAVGFNAVLAFPFKYDGGDPLAAYGLPGVRELTTNMVRAIAGDAEARNWFRQEENLLYCSELAHVTVSAGLLFPLNAATFEPLVGPVVWEEFRRQIEAHNRGVASAFTELSQNRQVGLVELATAPAGLERAPAYAPTEAQKEAETLAFRPMTATDVVDLFLRTYVPREHLGDASASLQAELLARATPTILALSGLRPEDAGREDLERLLERMATTVAGSYRDDAHYRATLEPLLAEGRRLTLARTQRGEGLYVPPSLLHLTALGEWPSGLLGLRYVGHGLHVSLVRPASVAEE